MGQLDHGADLAGPPAGTKTVAGVPAGAGAATGATGRLRDGLTRAVALLYPPACLACGAPAEAAQALCGACWHDARFLADGLACDLCGTPLPGTSDRAELCDGCLRHPRPWARGRAALAYEGTGRALALALKHGDRTDLARPLGAWMARAARPLLDDLGAREAALVPVPLHWTRLFARRHNQAALLARAVGGATGLPVHPDALVRTRRTASLGHLTAARRAEALDGAVRPHPRRGRALEGRVAILVDDVMASGATLAACARAAATAGAAEVRVLLLARALREDGPDRASPLAEAASAS